MTREYIYAESYGMVYRFTPRKWKRMLQTVINGNDVKYSDFGTYVLTIGHNITDITPESAQGMLDYDTYTAKK